ncbi:MAG: TetR/AcrR family transcriptional regulator [Rhodobacteraceae bacterium]|nr:TetR/AcrR family transcriptional regulator [Paracoccaceae bacterium]
MTDTSGSSDSKTSASGASGASASGTVIDAASEAEVCLGQKRRSIGAQRNPESAKAILAAAQEVLAEDGYKGFSIEKVARRAKAGKPTIYRWWPSKAALLLDVYRTRKQVDYPTTGNLEDDLVVFVQDVFRSWRETETGEIFRSMIAEAQSDEEASKVLSDYAADRREAFSQVIERAKARGAVGSDVNCEVTADWIASWLWVHLLTGRHDETPEATRAAIRQITQGIAKR